MMQAIIITVVVWSLSGLPELSAELAPVALRFLDNSLAKASLLET